MAFLRSMITSTTAIAAVTALPAAFALSSLSLNSSSCASSPASSSSASSSSSSRAPSFGFLSPKPILSSQRLGLVKGFSSAPSAVVMDNQKSSQNAEMSPELLTEYMVDMTCEGCVRAVKSKLESVEGVKKVDVELSNQVVRVLGTTTVKTMTEALEQTGRKARLIGQGVPEDFLVSAAVAEFKGPEIFGVVRLAQVSMELARIEANFSGLSPGRHSWSINEFGDLTRGAASTGKIYDPEDHPNGAEPVGDLGTLDVDEKGEAFFSGVKPKLRVADLIGRALVVYGSEDNSVPGVAAAVIARSAGVGENYKKLCTCDGTTIWEATNSDFVSSKA